MKEKGLESKEQNIIFYLAVMPELIPKKLKKKEPYPIFEEKFDLPNFYITFTVNLTIFYLILSILFRLL